MTRAGRRPGERLKAPRAPKGAFHRFALAVTVLCSLFLTVPVLMTATVAFSKNAFRGPSSGFTLDWFSKVLGLYGDTVIRSLYLGLATLALCTLLGVPAAYAFVKAGKSRAAAFLEEALVLPLSVPGISIGLGILLCWGTVTWFRQSWLFLLAGHTVFCLPFMVRPVAAVLRVIPLDVYEEAAATLGERRFMRFIRIAAPLALPGILSGALMALTLSIGEFNVSWMLQTPFTRTLPVGLADSYASLRLEIGSAYTVIFFAILVPALALLQKLPEMAGKGKRPGPAGEEPEEPMPDTSPGGQGARMAGPGPAAALDAPGRAPQTPLTEGPLPQFPAAASGLPPLAAGSGLPALEAGPGALARTEAQGLPPLAGGPGRLARTEGPGLPAVQSKASEAARAGGFPAAARLEPVPVRLEGCAKSFGGQTVVHPFSLEIPAGGKCVILGPSGCGKTTVLRLIAGLERPDPGGRVLLGARDVTDVPPEGRRTGMVFQSYALFPHMTVEGNVGYGLKVRGIPKKEAARTVAETLEMVRLEGAAKRDVNRLSGGQRQRVALARALAVKPRVLLMDEPLAALDALLRAGVREELDRLLTSLGITTVIVTHDLDEAMSLGELIVVMKSGRIEQAGTPLEIWERPASAFVAGFVGGSNRLDGRLEGDFLILPGGAAVPRALLAEGQGNGCGNGRGGKVSVFFRPDRPRLAPAGLAGMRGTVVSSRFVGAKTRLLVKVERESFIRIELSGADHVRIGSDVGVEVPPESLFLFEAAAGAGSASL
jgi:putative spermidine/putrescine transport system ATP-binding protein